MTTARTYALGFMFLVALVVLPPASTALAASCDKGSCNARITTSVWTGQPTLQCSEFDVVVRIVVEVCCPGACTGTQTFYRCGASNESHQFSACGATHTVSLSGGTWEDALLSCGAIVYTAQ
jgi:hypothetical protein